MSVALIMLRRGAAPIAVPVMILIGWFAGTRGDHWPDWGAATGTLQQHGVLLVPITAAVAAWDVSRMRRTRSALLNRTIPRSQLTMALVDCLGALLAGCVGWVTTLLVMAGSVDGGRGPYWSVILLGVFCFVPAVLIGAVCGMYLPRYLAAPLTAIGVWLAFAFGSGSENPLLVRLAVVNEACCDVDTQPIPATVLGQWLWLTGLTLGAMAIVAGSDRIRALPLAGTAVAAVSSAMVMITGAGSALVEPRVPTSEACQTRGNLTVCLWPEHAGDAAAWLDAAGDFHTRFDDLGDLPRRYVERGLRPGAPDTVVITSIPPGTPRSELVGELAHKLIPPPPGCAATGPGSYGPFPAASSRSLLRGWIKRTVHPDAPAHELVRDSETADLDRLSNLPRQRQIEWYRGVVAAHQDCRTSAPRVP